MFSTYGEINTIKKNVTKLRQLDVRLNTWLKKHDAHDDTMRLLTDTHLVSFEFLILLVDEELVLGDLGLDGAEKRAALVRVHWLVLQVQCND